MACLPGQKKPKQNKYSFVGKQACHNFGLVCAGAVV